MAQLSFDSNGLYLNNACYHEIPDDIEYGSGDWQRWAANTLKKMVSHKGFNGKDVITMISSDHVFVEQIKIPKSARDNLETKAFENVKQKLPFDPKDAMVQYIVSDGLEDSSKLDVMVIAAQREKVDRYLAIYEKAGLMVKGMSVASLAITNSYFRFFGRRSDDAKAIAILVDIGYNHSDIIICKEKKPLFARMIPIGIRQLNNGTKTEELTEEINACWRYFESSPTGGNIERLIFFSGNDVNNEICKKMGKFAEQKQIPAQIADVLAAVRIRKDCDIVLQKCDCSVDWARVFGLCLTAL